MAGKRSEGPRKRPQVEWEPERPLLFGLVDSIEVWYRSKKLENWNELDGDGILKAAMHAERLAELGTPKAIKALSDYGFGNHNSAIAANVIHRISCMGTKRSLKILGEVGLNHPKSDVQIASAQELGDSADTRALGYLKPHIEDENEELVHAVKRAITRIRDSQP